MKKSIFILLLIVVGCAGMRIPDEGSEGAKLYALRCSACHALAHPKRHNFAEWKGMLAIMERHMEDRSIQPLTKDERGAILEYLKRHSRRAP